MAKDKAPLPFTPEFARAVCELYQAAGKAADAAGAIHIVEVSGVHIRIGGRDSSRRIDITMGDELIELAYGGESP